MMRILQCILVHFHQLFIQYFYFEIDSV